MEQVKNIFFSIKPQNPNTKWVALDLHERIISEGDSPVSVAKDAQKKTNDFSLMFIPTPGNIYIL